MRRSLSTILALTALVAACGGGSGAATTAPTGAPATQAAATDEASANAGVPTPGTVLDACEIVTPDDINAATGATDTVEGVLKPAPTSLSPGGTQCRYEGSFGRVTVDLTPEDGANLYDAAVGAYEDAELLDGIGGGAFNSEQNNRAFIWKGAVTVMLTMFLEGAEQKAVAQALGAAIISKL